MNKYNWVEIRIYWIDTTELESYKQVELQGGGKKLGFVKETAFPFSGSYR